MLSLKQQMNAIDLEEQRFHAAFDCYLAALTTLDVKALEITPELSKEHRTDLRSLHRALFADRTIEALVSAQDKLNRILESQRRDYQSYQAQQDNHLRSLIGNLTLAAETMTTRNQDQGRRWKLFTSELQDTARLTDLSEIKRQLETRIEQLRVTSQSISDENRASVSKLEAKLTEIQTRLAEAEKNAITDSLTGLLNRAGGESRLRKGMRARTLTGILMIDLNGFKQINDRWGHACGDKVLEMFSRKLERLIRPEDTVCRWGGDEFLVTLQGSAPQAIQRAHELQAALRAKYRVALQGTTIEVEIAATVGVAEANAAKTMEELIAHADANMYQNKNGKALSLVRTQAAT